jgi:hypothetical protein
VGGNTIVVEGHDFSATMRGWHAFGRRQIDHYHRDEEEIVPQHVQHYLVIGILIVTFVKTCS